MQIITHSTSSISIKNSVASTSSTSIILLICRHSRLSDSTQVTRQGISGKNSSQRPCSILVNVTLEKTVEETLCRSRQTLPVIRTFQCLADLRGISPNKSRRVQIKGWSQEKIHKQSQNKQHVHLA